MVSLLYFMSSKISSNSNNNNVFYLYSTLIHIMQLHKSEYLCKASASAVGLFNCTLIPPNCIVLCIFTVAGAFLYSLKCFKM